ncbi:Trm112 family protein [Stenotrophomonas sp. HITSZ_GD]|uniref:Trm112 family protein n=1 Tax=Stenotrophomonas sp. HITSZ_GD TaxID=3037248 RepID=UPI00240D47BC|nr:Trm112 family protein [Stenotrophomonas sp. HITSZ_GD]MDG2524551.1 Trm112 family protein [Stenotrophomonas sp. HITSZ_GD]
MDRKLLDLLCSPHTRQPLGLLESAGLDALNRAIAAGNVRKADGEALAQPLREALVSRDRKQIFRVEDGIPVLLAEEAIDTSQVADFPAR